MAICFKEAYRAALARQTAPEALVVRTIAQSRPRPRPIRAILRAAGACAICAALALAAVWALPAGAGPQQGPVIEASGPAAESAAPKPQNHLVWGEGASVQGAKNWFFIPCPSAEEYDFMDWSRQDYARYCGVEELLLPRSLPQGLRRTTPATSRIALSKTDGSFYKASGFNAWLESYEGEGMTLHLAAFPGEIPQNAGNFIFHGPRDFSDHAYAPNSQVGGVAVFLSYQPAGEPTYEWVLDAGENEPRRQQKFDGAGNPILTEEVCYAEWMFQGVGYVFFSNGMPRQAFEEALLSMFG